eukprot:6212699-Pleurochrysis_carterae.AAC.2
MHVARAGVLACIGASACTCARTCVRECVRACMRARARACMATCVRAVVAGRARVSTHLMCRVQFVSYVHVCTCLLVSQPRQFVNKRAAARRLRPRALGRQPRCRAGHAEVMMFGSRGTFSLLTWRRAAVEAECPGDSWGWAPVLRDHLIISRSYLRRKS